MGAHARARDAEAAWGTLGPRLPSIVQICYTCGAVVFFHTNGNGDVVFFDSLGKPWPRHPCLTSEASRRRSMSSKSDRWRQVLLIASLDRRPSGLALPASTKLVLGSKPDPAEWAGRRLRGVVAVVSEERPEWARFDSPGSRSLRVRHVDLFVQPNFTLVIVVPSDVDPNVGDILETQLHVLSFEYRSMLYGADARVIRGSHSLRSAILAPPSSR